MTSVLYDAQGPRAKRRNILYSALFLVAFAALLWWVITSLNDKDQLAWEKAGKPFVHGEAWSTYLWPGLLEHPQGRGPRHGHRPAAPSSASPGSPTTPGSGYPRPRSWSSSAPSRCWS